MLPKHIVLIEDDSDIQKMVTLALAFTAGAEVTAAGNGETGIATVKGQQPGLVLLDVMLPDMDGYAIIQQLKGDPTTCDIPVIFLSARAQASEIVRGTHLGAVGYLVKPFDPMTLAKEIDRLLTN